MKTKNRRIKTYIENQRYRIDVHRITALKDGATRWKEPKGPWNGDARKTMDGLHLVAPGIYIGDSGRYGQNMVVKQRQADLVKGFFGIGIGIDPGSFSRFP